MASEHAQGKRCVAVVGDRVVAQPAVAGDHGHAVPGQRGVGVEPASLVPGGEAGRDQVGPGPHAPLPGRGQRARGGRVRIGAVGGRDVGVGPPVVRHDPLVGQVVDGDQVTDRGVDHHHVGGHVVQPRDRRVGELLGQVDHEGAAGGGPGGGVVEGGDLGDLHPVRGEHLAECARPLGPRVGDRAGKAVGRFGQQGRDRHERGEQAEQHAGGDGPAFHRTASTLTPGSVAGASAAGAGRVSATSAASASIASYWNAVPSRRP